MRDFAKVSPLFWTRGSGRRLRGNVDAQLVALYLLSCPSANMIGVYYVPTVTLAHETGLSEQRALAALAALEDAEFAFYDVAAELAWVPNMAAYQIGDTMKGPDKRRGGVLAELERVAGHRFAGEFWDRYGDAYGLGPMPEQEAPSKPLRSPFEGASGIDLADEKPLRRGNHDPREEKEKEKEKETEKAPPSQGAPPAGGRGSRGTRLPAGWSPSPATVERFAGEGVDALGSLERFRDYWAAASGKAAVKVDWEAAFRNWVREDIARGRAAPYVPPREPVTATRLRAEPASPEVAAKFRAELVDILDAQRPLYLREAPEGHPSGAAHSEGNVAPAIGIAAGDP